MALRRCRNCTCRFAVGLNVCPQCGSKDHHEEGAPPAVSDMKKPELQAEAERRGVEFTSKTTVDELRELLAG